MYIVKSADVLSNVELVLSMNIDAEKIERTAKFQRAAASELRRRHNRNRGVDFNQLGRFPEYAVPHPDFARHDRALRALAAFKKPTRDQSLIDSRLLFHHCVMSSEVETSLDISEIVRDSSTPLGMTIYPISPRNCVP